MPLHRAAQASHFPWFCFTLLQESERNARGEGLHTIDRKQPRPASGSKRAEKNGPHTFTLEKAILYSHYDRGLRFSCWWSWRLVYGHPAMEPTCRSSRPGSFTARRTTCSTMRSRPGTSPESDSAPINSARILHPSQARTDIQNIRSRWFHRPSGYPYGAQRVFRRVPATASGAGIP